MGWKARVKEIADRNPNAVPPELLTDSSKHDSRRWPETLKNVARNAVVAVVSIATIFYGLHILSVSYELDAAQIRYALAIASFLFASLFCLMSESLIEDGVKTVLVLAIGLTLAFSIPLPWCVMPGFGAAVGSIANWTVKATMGQHY
ncbi:hypothetical protein [Adhaeretor mobilis]|uniref:Uncharacterized protein n=1 Tax=Adhaeretor mobilis TaxID=1930276 RepID=A0A517MTQ8_9BACT|nr:hypothetical protein [Adhaeretor mobilis]QDS98271.1 hypothetical protein HG15A2_15440 [Adhaeretor mobilis]